MWGKLVLICVLLVVSSTALADRESARLHFQRGTALFDLQRYSDAAVEYEKAFEAWNDPALLFNIAQSYRLAGNYQKAIGAYRSFLRRVPKTPNRAEVEARIAEMQRLVSQQHETAERPPQGQMMPTAEPPPDSAPTRAEPVQAPPARDRPTLKWAGVGLLAGGVALVVSGGALVGVAQAASNDLTHASPGTVFSPSKESTYKVDSAAGAAILAVGGACAIGGAALLAIALRHRSEHASLSPIFTLGPQGAAFGLVVRR